MPVRRWWYRLMTTLWFVPAVIVVSLWVLALAILALDATGSTALTRFTLPWLQHQSAAAAQAILATLAGALMTVVALLFSITVVVLQLASAAYSPRLLPNFMADRNTQLVFGIYVGTFAFTMQVLQQIRSGTANDADVVPDLAITGAILLSLICLGLLVYYIHYIAHAIQPSSIIKGMHDQLLQALKLSIPLPETIQRLPTGMEAEARARIAPDWSYTEIRAEQGGYLESLDYTRLLSQPGVAMLLCTRPAVGSYVISGSVLAEIWSAAPIPPATMTTLRRSFRLERERSDYQDPLFAIRKLADIALKALSPAINDPTTAEEAIWYLTDGIRRLSRWEFPPRVCCSTDQQRWYLLNQPAFDDYVAEAYDQIREAGRTQAHVMHTLILALLGVLDLLDRTDRRMVLAGVLADLAVTLPQTDLLPREKAELQARIHAAADEIRA